MFTVLESRENLIEVKKSRFHGSIFHIESEAGFSSALKEVRKLHPKADHIVYGYILSERDRGYSDANEPKGTAGRPVLNVLEKNNLVMVALFTVRYFGGIKLGAGGLVRAYTQTASELIASSVRRELLEAFEVSFKLKYEALDAFMAHQNEKGCEIIEKEFASDVSIKAAVNEETLASLKSDARVFNLSVIRSKFLHPF
ncbi:MAG: YigZ family protein [bacterium]|nr:YigZ family protein [bacterium]